jgi:5-methylcytosine-specific restriction endonuclease McrA
MIDAYGLLCNICKEPINFVAPRKVGKLGWERGLHIDHVVPLSKGGSDTLANIRPTHGLCNLQKSNSHGTIVPTTE